jgi:hypothetical protein
MNIFIAIKPGVRVSYQWSPKHTVSARNSGLHKQRNQTVNSWRTLVYQEVILRIGPLGKLGRFESSADFFLFILLQSAY